MDANLMAKAQEMAQQAKTAGSANLANPNEKPQNPAERPRQSRAERQRIPMSVPMQRLYVPDIPGWHLHWFLNSPARIARAQQAGYVFVETDEVDIANFDLGGESAASGNTSLGSHVSVVSGDEVGRDGQPVQLVLMKLPQELWLQDQVAVEDRNEQVAKSLRGGDVGLAGNPGDPSQRYVGKQTTPNLFTRKHR